MKTKKESPEVQQLRKELEEAKVERLKAIEAAQAAHNRWVEEAQKNGQYLGDSMKIQKLQHQLEVLSLIAEGKPLEAMQSVLRTDVMLFNIQVVMADDQTRIAAEDETLEKMKKHLVEQIQGVKLVRKEPMAASE